MAVCDTGEPPNPHHFIGVGQCRFRFFVVVLPAELKHAKKPERGQCIFNQCNIARLINMRRQLAFWQQQGTAEREKTQLSGNISQCQV